MIVKLKDGLGNQMFQYAFAISYGIRNNKKVKLDDSILALKLHAPYRNYELGIFPISLKMSIFPYALTNYYFRFQRKFFKEKNIIEEVFGFNEGFLNKKNAKFADGYFQSEKYFKINREIILKEFKFPELDANSKVQYEKLYNHCSVSIHIRRGDYVNHPMHSNICTLDYYVNAINFMKNKMSASVFVVFSDDMDWCKENLGLDNAIYIEGNKGNNSFRDMQLMSLCNHNIIANSTFSWWGAWLNQNPEKIVISPKKWFNDVQMNTGDIVPDDWLKI